jgi:thiosulfate dehydrogenase (quinone) large subunit
MNSVFARPHREIQDPPFARLLFSDTRSAWLWLPIRLWLGWEWLQAGWHKVTDPGWMQGGQALAGFWKGAIEASGPDAERPRIAFGWYLNFIEGLYNSGSYTWFAPLVAWGEVLVGLGLMVGAFVGIAAFFGALLNFNFIMAGAASTNGLLFLLAVLLMLAWKVAGYIGLDAYLLPRLGTPWRSMDARALNDRPLPNAVRF